MTVVPARLEPNGERGSMVFVAFVAGELVAAVTSRGDDADRVVAELRACIEPVVGDGDVTLVAYDGATGWPLPIGDRPVAAGL